ncbi:MAG TPA: hypothetical protein VJT67_00620 [Longimicrobiaceae bacterium]|nr:hypothetical protein [Longimicrobiaceae bacterium]
MSRKPALAGVVAALAALAAASPPAGQAYVGTWTGTVTRPGAETGTWPVAMELGPLVGSIRFPTLRCGGSLTRIRAGSSPVFSELLEYGRERCVTGLRVRVSAVTATTLLWEEINAGGEVRAYGTLTRTNLPPSTAGGSGTSPGRE